MVYSQRPQHIIDKIKNARKGKSKSLNLAKEDLTEIPVEVLELDFLGERNLSENQVSLDKVEAGIEIAQDLAGKYNKIAEWCGMPVVPSVFLKKK